MADEQLTTGTDTQETGLVPTPAVQSQPEAPTGDKPQSAASPVAPSSGADRVDLFALPEFQKYQRQQNQQLDAMRQQLTAYQQQQQQLEQERLAQMDPQERLAYQLQQREAQLQQYQRYVADLQEQEQRRKDLEELSRKTGAPIKVLDVATKYDEAVEIAIGWMKQNAPAVVAAQQAKAEANKPVVGAGAIPTTDEQERQVRQSLLREGKTKEYMLRVIGKG